MAFLAVRLPKHSTRVVQVDSSGYPALVTGLARMMAVASPRFDIVANIPQSASKKHIPEIFQTLLVGALQARYCSLSIAGAWAASPLIVGFFVGNRETGMGNSTFKKVLPA